MYTKILVQGTKFGSGTTGLDNPVVYDRAVHTRLPQEPKMGLLTDLKSPY